MREFDLRLLLEKKQEEVDRLQKGYCELKEKCDKGECDCIHEEYHNLINQNMKLLEENEILYSDNVVYNKMIDELNARIDKAIEYLKKREYDNECCSVCSVMSDTLLEILGDEDNEN